MTTKILQFKLPTHKKPELPQYILVNFKRVNRWRTSFSNECTIDESLTLNYGEYVEGDFVMKVKYFLDSSKGIVPIRENDYIKITEGSKPELICFEDYKG